MLSFEGMQLNLWGQGKNLVETMETGVNEGATGVAGRNFGVTPFLKMIYEDAY